MKTNSELQHDVQAELNWAPNITAREIGVTALDGVITLTGQVPSYFEKIEVEEVAGRVAGVMAIAEELKVQLPSFNQRTDAEVAKTALNFLAWNLAVPHDQVKVKVENGWITLTGEVERYFQKTAAANAIRYLMGVKGVTNLITIKAGKSANATEIKTTIENAFKRIAMADAQKITVTVHEGNVTLKGKARSLKEKDEAFHNAWAASGVSSVENDIVVSNQDFSTALSDL